MIVNPDAIDNSIYYMWPIGALGWHDVTMLERYACHGCMLMLNTFGSNFPVLGDSGIYRPCILAASIVALVFNSGRSCFITRTAKCSEISRSSTGALVHSRRGKITRYQLVVPTWCWDAIGLIQDPTDAVTINIEIYPSLTIFTRYIFHVWCARNKV